MNDLREEIGMQFSLIGRIQRFRHLGVAGSAVRVEAGRGGSERARLQPQE